MNAVKNLRNNYYLYLVEQFNLIPIESKHHHTQAIKFLEKIMDISESVSEEELKAIKEYSATLVILIQNFEKSLIKLKPNFSPVDVLKFLMEQNNLTQEDFQKELGSQSTVSKILNGTQSLKDNQIEALAKKFKIYPAAFFPAA